MPTFTVQVIIEFETRQPVNKLIRDGKCLIDEFIEEIKKDTNLEPELGDLYAIIEDVADGKRSPRFRKLNLKGKLKYAAFEAKSSNLRLYVIQEKRTGMIFIIGGKKTEQDEDLERLEQIIKQYSAFK